MALCISDTLYGAIILLIYTWTLPPEICTADFVLGIAILLICMWWPEDFVRWLFNYRPRGLDEQYIIALEMRCHLDAHRGSGMVKDLFSYDEDVHKLGKLRLYVLTKFNYYGVRSALHGICYIDASNPDEYTVQQARDELGQMIIALRWMRERFS